MDKTISHEEHYIQVEYYQDIIKNLQNDIYNLKMKDTTNKDFIEILKAKLENLNNNQILT
jgi:hypothetical protein|tara:strand:- start:477 stop:656 length:180 start_codon:yes stop_codon:yes gene_type:complete